MRMVIDYLFEKSAPGGFDLIVMDIMMPEMNGYGAARGYQYAAKGVGKCIMSFDIIMIKTAEKRIKKVKKSVDTDSILCYTMSCVEITQGHAPLAQLAEHLTLNQGVQGSNPWRRT